MRMSAGLEWTQATDGGLEKAQGFQRTYRLFKAGDKYFVTLTAGGSAAVSRGWARTPDEVKRIAEKWESVLYQYQMPGDRPAGYWPGDS